MHNIGQTRKWCIDIHQSPICMGRFSAHLKVRRVPQETSRASEWVNRMRMSHGHVSKLNRCWSLFVPLSLLRSASAASSRDDVDRLCVASLLGEVSVLNHW